MPSGAYPSRDHWYVLTGHRMPLVESRSTATEIVLLLLTAPSVAVMSDVASAPLVPLFALTAVICPCEPPAFEIVAVPTVPLVQVTSVVMSTGPEIE